MLSLNTSHSIPCFLEYFNSKGISRSRAEDPEILYVSSLVGGVGGGETEEVIRAVRMRIGNENVRGAADSNVLLILLNVLRGRIEGLKIILYSRLLLKINLCFQF